MPKKWIASGIIPLLGILILVIRHLDIKNLDATLLFLLGSFAVITGIILTSFAFVLTISEQL